MISLRSGVLSEAHAIERWDINAPVRDTELSENGDPSYRALKHLVLDGLAEAEVAPGSRILDAGCGLGYLSEDLSASGYVLDAIDPSFVSIEMAERRRVASGMTAIRFAPLSLQEFAKDPTNHGQFAAIVANMTLHSVSDLQTFMYAAATLLTDTGVLIATIPNPRTYLQSRAELDVSQVDLRVEQVFEIEFRIRNHAPHPAPVIFFHRPIRLYSVAGENAGLTLRESRVPDRIGPGRPRDIALLEFARSRRKK